jgi:hypothetical protein
MSHALEARVRRFQELIAKGFYYRRMNFNLYMLKAGFRKGHGRYVKLEKWELRNHTENWVFF